jgi:hypothetical protein
MRKRERCHRHLVRTLGACQCAGEAFALPVDTGPVRQVMRICQIVPPCAGGLHVAPKQGWWLRVSQSVTAAYFHDAGERPFRRTGALGCTGADRRPCPSSATRFWLQRVADEGRSAPRDPQRRGQDSAVAVAGLASFLPWPACLPRAPARRRLAPWQDARALARSKAGTASFFAKFWLTAKMVQHTVSKTRYIVPYFGIRTHSPERRHGRPLGAHLYNGGQHVQHHSPRFL